ncbi:MAG TPA: ATP-dependent metallopeptidase FtsH/Yme1/Tma family protein [bacterium]|nr:ATP-dependent metallopeptidase FtsH/Yme1/Tma family protein [bacterium]HEX68464.1 ATP-dependent metallopeptidase FtsH/Yme1/Tma family protein [bacterium]
MGKKKNNQREKFFHALAFWLVLGILIMWVMSFFSTGPQIPEKITYTQFLKAVEEDRVKKVIISENYIKGNFIDGKKFTTYAPKDPELMKILKEKGVEIIAKPQENFWRQIILSAFPLLIFIFFLWFFIYRQMQIGGNKALTFAKSRAKLIIEDRPKVTFQDVAGVDEAKEELKEIIEFLKDPGKFQRLGGKIPKGVLLIGPPGTGKTLLARAVAGEAKVPFFSISGSDFVEMFVGVGAARVRDLFEQAKKHAPCLIFIDEIDAVGRQRFAGLGGGHDEREQTLNQLLVEMDGFDTREGIIVIAATNRPDVLDPALLRPGRFDRQIVIDKPDVKGREAILKVHARNVVLDKDVDLNIIARETPGFSGADLANLVNEAALLAARRGKNAVSMQELEEAIERVMAGPERKSRVISEFERKLVAYHEAGHALLAYLLPHADPVHKVSIIPRGVGALGYTMQLPMEDRYLMTRTELEERIIVLLGGRASEELFFNEYTTGAHNDLKLATEMAQKMVCDFGMSEKLGPITLGGRGQEVFLGRDLLKEKNYSENLAAEIDQEVRRIIGTCYEKAKELVKKNKKKVEKLAKALLEKEVMDGEEVKRILSAQSKGKRKKTPSS